MIENSDYVLLFDIGLLIVASSISVEIFKKLKLPSVIGAIIVGVFIGGEGGVGLISDFSAINVLATLGLILILFSTGLEFNASSFWRVGKTAFLLTTIGVIFSVLLGYWIGVILGYSWQAALILGAVLAPSGTSVIAALLSNEKIVGTRFGSTLLTAVIIDDIEGILILSIVLSLVSETVFSTATLLRVSLVSSLFIFGTIFLGAKIAPLLIKRMEIALSQEVFLPLLLGLGLIFAYVATQVGLSAVTGAFIMGAIIPYELVGEKLVSRIQMTKDILAGLFFASIGLVINPLVMLFSLPFGLIILFVALIARIVGGLLGGRLAGLRGKELLLSVLGLSIRAEMSFIIAYEGIKMGIVGYDFLTLTAVSIIGSMVVIIPFFTRILKSHGSDNAAFIES